MLWCNMKIIYGIHVCVDEKDCLDIHKDSYILRTLLSPTMYLCSLAGTHLKRKNILEHLKSCFGRFSNDDITQNFTFLCLWIFMILSSSFQLLTTNCPNLRYTAHIKQELLTLK